MLIAFLLLFASMSKAYGIPCQGVVQRGSEHKHDLSGKNRVFRIGSRDFVPLWNGSHWEILERNGTCEDGNPLVQAPFQTLTDIQLFDKSASAWDIFFDVLTQQLHAIACHNNPVHRRYVRIEWNVSQQRFENKFETPLAWLPKCNNPLKIMADHDGHLLVLYDGDDNAIKLRRSADNGVTWEPEVTLQSGILSGTLKATLDMVRYTFADDREMQFIYGLANGDIYRKRIDTPEDKADYDIVENWTSELVYSSGEEPRSHAVILHAENFSDEVAIVYQTQTHYIQMLFWNGSEWEAARQLSTNKRRRHSATWDVRNNQIHAFIEGNISLGNSDILRGVFTIATRSWEPEEVVINDGNDDMERPDPIRVTQDGSIFLVSDNNSRNFRVAWNLITTAEGTGPQSVNCSLGDMTQWFKDKVANSARNWVTGTFRVALVDDTYTFDATQDQNTEVNAKRVGPLAMLHDKAIVRDDNMLMVKFDASDALFPSVAAGQIATGAVVVNGSKVVGHCNFEDVETNGEDIIVRFSSSGLFQF
ncbi:hypothetical protein [Candidatus Entotheonella palauensis]|uniref:hypothetical protein n=1 Tax=Candidatus Entotheonella palauensis TaxID=93172 RepID=UPI0015C43CE1|nr:hypothetical protein [Candidatus Entotheonella palauensis]